MVELVTDPDRIKELRALYSDPAGNFPGVVTDPTRVNDLNQQFGFDSTQLPDRNQFSLGVERGVKNVQASGNIFAAGIAQYAGADALSDALFDNYQFYSAQANQLEGSVNFVEDIKDINSFANWLAGRLGENVPNILGFILSGGAGALIGKAVSKGVVNQIEKQMLDRVLPGILPRTTVGRGALAGAGSFTTVLEGGGVAAEQLENGFEVQPGVYVPAGLIMGSLEVLSTAIGFSAFGLNSAFRLAFLNNLKKLPIAKRIAATGALVGTVEGSTETAQELVAISARKVIDENYDTLGDEVASRLKNAAASGVAVGTVFGSFGGVFGRGPGRPNEQTDVSDTETETEGNIFDKEIVGEDGIARDVEGNQLALPAPQLQLAPPSREERVVAPVEDRGVLEVPPGGLPQFPALPSPGQQLDAEVQAEPEVQVTKLVNDKLETEAVVEESELEVADTIREINPEQDTGPKTTPTAEDVITPIDEIDGEINFNNLSAAQSNRLKILLEKNRVMEEEFGEELTDTEAITMDRLIGLSEKEKVTPQNKESVKELNELGTKVNNDETVLKRKGGEGQNRSVEDVGSVVAGIAAGFPGAPPVRVVDHADMANDKVVFDKGHGAKGLFVNRNGQTEIYIFANEAGNNADILKTYLHEVTGHAGLRALFNEAELKTFLRLINEDDLIAADERVAILAQNDPKSSILKRIIALVRTALRRLGFTIKMSDNDIVAVLANVRGAFSNRVTQSNFARIQALASPSTIEAYRKNLGMTMRFFSQVNVGKNKYIDQQTITRIKKNMNKHEEALLDAVILDFNSMGLLTKNITWQELVERLETHFVPLEAVTLKEIHPNGTTLDDAFDAQDLALTVEDDLKYFNQETNRLENSLVADNFPTNVGFSVMRTVMYEVPFQTVDISEPLHRIHFQRSKQLGWVRSADYYGTRLLAEIQADLEQRLLSESSRQYHVDQAGLFNVMLSLSDQLAGMMQETKLRGLRNDKIVAAARDMKTRLKGLTLWQHTPNRPDDFQNTLDQVINIYEKTSLLVIPSEQFTTLAYEQVLDIGQYAQQAAFILRLHVNTSDNIQIQPNFRKETKPLFTFYRERLFRESMKQAAIDEMVEVALLSPEHFRHLQFQGKALEELDDSQKSVLSHYKKFLNWVHKNYRGREGYKVKSGYIYVPTSPLDQGPITVLARRAQNLNRENGLPPEDPTPYAVDRFEGMWEFMKVKFSKLILNPLQIEVRYKIKEISEYLAGVQRWWNIKAKIIAGIEDLATQWNALDKGRAGALSNAIIDITVESDAVERRLTPVEMEKVFTKYKLDEESKDIYARMDREMQKLLTRIEQGVLRNEARIKMGVDPTAFMDDWNKAQNSQQKTEVLYKYDMSALTARSMFKIEKEFRLMRNRNYFPYTRFGRFVIDARAKFDITYKGKQFAKGESVFMYAYESRAEQLLGQENHAAAFKDKRLNVQLGELDDTEMTFMGMPPSLLTSIQSTLSLTEEQVDRLKQIFSNLSPGRSFMRELKQRSGLEGFSQETLRVFASYMFSAANHVARVEQYLNMTKALDRLGDLRKDPQLGDSVVLAELHQYFKKHYKYIMNPGTDLAHVRALGFMFYLGGNVKSAVVNLTQIPMVAYPYLAARFNSDSGAIAALSRAINDTSAGLTGKPRYTKYESESITRAINEGFLDESQVTDIAGMGESHVLARIMPSNSGKRFWNQLSYGAGYLFHQAELFNRRVTFIAGLRLAQNQNKDPEYAYQEAKRAVQTAQFEYSKWNRPEFMRGNKSVIFLFWQFMQQATFLAMGGQGGALAMRMLGMMLLAGGLEGLPLAENLLDILDFGGTKAKEAFGMKNPRVDLREEIRIMLQELTDNPDIVMHGMARYYGLGPLHLFGALGVPVPEVDITSSLSMGKIIPGIEDMFQTSRNAEQKFARTIVEMGGPVMGIGYNFYRWAVVDEPDTWKAAERVLPTALKNMSKAMRRFERGQETNRSGAAIIEYEPGNWKEQGELIANALGFASTRGNQKYELLAAQEEARRFWLVRRSGLLEKYGYAVIVKDREGIKDARKAIKDFNRTVPAPQLRVRGDQMAQSVKLKRRKVKDMEEGRATQKLYRPVTQNVRKAFPEVQ